ncbi:hypothetical protein HC028_21270 [Planosporangium flavigriseum]|uniref:hypothetical protein n=1 Tax=Planosporangium flavigriseum TaxID=373681 RepID=UPI0014399AC1|nr:hypothetical protein [Planosporangium flavigriseum]NJC67015.1 hypothetical protein [Planosporangium flavigriseum]
MTEAAEYLQRYLAAREPRLRWLADLAAGTGGPAPEQLDFSRQSLVPLWEWAMKQFRLRDEDKVVDPTRVPMWYGRSPAPAAYWWSDETLDLIDAVIYYFGECLRRAVPGARWEVGHAPYRNWVNENQPVLTGFTSPFNPFLPIPNIVGRVYYLLRPDEPRPNGIEIPPATAHDLRDQFDNEMRKVASP